jgi:hypothetical protein
MRHISSGRPRGGLAAPIPDRKVCKLPPILQPVGGLRWDLLHFSDVTGQRDGCAGAGAVVLAE